MPGGIATKTCRRTSKQRNAYASYGWISTVGKLGTGLLNSPFCSSIGSEIKTGINSGIYLICKKQNTVNTCGYLLCFTPIIGTIKKINNLA